MIARTAFQRFVAVVFAALLCSSAQAALHTVIVGGLGGEKEYEEQFRKNAEALAAAVARLDSEQKPILLAGPKSDATALRRALTTVATQAAVEDRLIVMLVGHGTFDGDDFRFNLHGPDITGAEFANLLNRINVREQVIVLASSASGGALTRLQRTDTKMSRVVITATKSGTERNAVRFAEHWVSALTSAAADVDKDEWVTVKEAFEYAERKVADGYKSSASLATEHPRIYEVGVMKAEQIPIARLGSGTSMPTDVELRSLFTERLRIEREVAAVKDRKDELGETQYYDEIEKVLITLAKTQLQIDARQTTLGQPKS
ncbi:MAG: hypothetical protein H7Y02_09620 [Candidatus Obscuribacterales bacterium]|nr:hypothetical protein [Steroidobacteraceae bacterium]